MATLREMTRPATTEASTSLTSSAIVWFGLAIVPLVSLVATLVDVPTALVTIAVASVLGGLAIFVSHGRSSLTAAGLYCLTAGVMTGGGCWYWATEDPPATDRLSILIAGLTIYGSTAVMYAIFWRGALDAGAAAPEARPPLNPEWARTVALLGLVIFASGAIAKELGLTLGTLAQSTAEVGAILFAASLLLSGGVRLARSPAQTLAISAMLVVFYLVIFNGGGRLRLVTVAIAIAVVAQYRLRTPIKLLAVAALVPTILFFASIGQSRVSAVAVDPNYQASASGLGSLVNPLATYAQLIEEHVTGGHGSTFVSEAVVLVPREVWADKPVQFGQIMVQKLHPGIRSDSNLSIPALDQGEWFYNFSWLGLLMMIVVTGSLLRWVDRRVRSFKNLERRGDVYLFVFFAILLGSISDLAWGGLSTWEVRNAQRLLVLLPILAWFYLPILRKPSEEVVDTG